MIRLARGLATLAIVGSLLSFSSTAVAADVGTGDITGTVTKEGFGFVEVDLFHSSGIRRSTTFADPADGGYAFTGLPAGTYKLEFRFGSVIQWAHQRLDFQSADTFTVTTGQTTVVDETMLKPGTIEVRATDSVTGQPVNTYCAALFDEVFPGNCGAVDGVLRIEDVGSGSHTVYLRPSDGLHFRQRVDDVAVRLGETTRIDVSLVPSAAITATVVDRATGEPVFDTCVAALPLRLGAIGFDTCQFNVNLTDEAGRVTVGELPAGRYTLLVVPFDDVHGIQWVGQAGGVGSQYAALRVDGVAGQLSTVSPIRLDPPATISGVIRDGATNEPLPGNGCASILPIWQGQSGPPGTETCTDFEGRYSLTRLGPYEWPVQFWHFYDYIYNYAPVWSGDARDRMDAELVRAGVDRPGKANAILRLEDGGLTGTINQANGDAQFDSTAFRLYNDRTGDLVNENTFFGGRYTLQGFAEQQLRVWFAAFPAPGSWYGGTSEAGAAPVRIREGRLTTLNLVAPPPA
jgi:hypothetical protein